MYSSIKRKKCKCSPDCPKYPTLGFSGYFAAHATQEIKDKVGTKRKVAQKNRAARQRVRGLVNKDAKLTGSAELKLWFSERRNQMTGYCDNCGNRTCKNDDRTYHYSLHHILPKAYFPSIATNQNNWLELCMWGEKSCHRNLEDGHLDMTEMSCWDKIVERFLAMYPSIADNEKRRIPDILMKYVKDNLP